MYDAWPWGFSPRLGVVYSVNNETVVRLSGSRTFGSVKNTGGSSHWNGFIGGYNVTAPALPASSAFNWDAGWPAWPEPPFLVPETLQRQQHPLLAAVRLGPPAGVLLLDAQRAAAAAGPVRRGGGLQRAARSPPHDEPPQPESGRPGDLLRLRPAVRAGRRHQPDELAHGLDRWRGRPNIPYPYPTFPDSQSVRQALRPFPQYLDINTGADGGDRSGRSSYHAFVLRGEKRYASGPDVPDLVCVLEDQDAAVGSRQRGRRPRDEPLQSRGGVRASRRSIRRTPSS